MSNDQKNLTLNELKAKLAAQERSIEDNKKQIEQAETKKQSLLEEIEKAKQAERSNIFDRALESVKEYSSTEFIIHAMTKTKVSAKELIEELVKSKKIKKSDLEKLALTGNTKSKINTGHIPSLYFSDIIGGKVVEQLAVYASDKSIGDNKFFKERVADNTIDKYKVTHAQWNTDDNKWIVWNDMCKTECPWSSETIDNYKLPYKCSVVGKELKERNSYNHNLLNGANGSKNKLDRLNNSSKA